MPPAATRTGSGNSSRDGAYPGAPDPAAEARARLMQPMPEPQPQISGFAMATLITGILAFLGGALLSVVFGIIALVQIRRRGYRGKGLVIAGLSITGAEILAVTMVLALAAAGDTPMRDDDGVLIRSGPIDADDLRVGDCLLRRDTLGIDYPGVPCAEPHQAEVYAVFDLLDTAWPDEQAIAAQAAESCVDLLLTASVTAYEDEFVDIWYSHPTLLSWSVGHRGVVCIATFADDPRTGSILND